MDVVTLVASAGGLGAVTTVLGGLSPDLPVPVVVQQHLGDQPSQLVAILRHRTGRDVVWGVDGTALAPGEVVVSPPRQTLRVLPDLTCTLTPSVHGAMDLPHDALMTSLAEGFGPRALALVLSGMGTDGAAGTTTMIRTGGVVLAQSEDTAEHPSMPLAASAAGARQVPLEEMAAEVERLVRQD